MAQKRTIGSGQNPIRRKSREITAKKLRGSDNVSTKSDTTAVADARQPLVRLFKFAAMASSTARIEPKAATKSSMRFAGLRRELTRSR